MSHLACYDWNCQTISRGLFFAGDLRGLFWFEDGKVMHGLV